MQLGPAPFWATDDEKAQYRKVAAFIRTLEPTRRQMLRDGEIELRSFQPRDGRWVVETAARFPEMTETLLFPDRRPMNHWFGHQLSALWDIGLGASWVVHNPERAGLVWAVRDPDSNRVALGGVRVPDVEHPPGQGARTMQLVAAYVRDTTLYAEPKLHGEPYVAIPCKDDRYVAWAKESGLPWDTEFPNLA
jgi:hypothetical protein